LRPRHWPSRRKHRFPARRFVFPADSRAASLLYFVAACNRFPFAQYRWRNRLLKGFGFCPRKAATSTIPIHGQHECSPLFRFVNSRWSEELVMKRILLRVCQSEFSSG
jgi:hypothetical protein